MHVARTAAALAALAALLAGCANSGGTVDAQRASTGTPSAPASAATPSGTGSSASATASAAAPSPSSTVVALPESALSPMTGYAYVAAPQLLELEQSMTKVSPDAPKYISGVAARLVTLNNKNMGTVFLFRCADGVPISDCGQFLLGFQNVWTRGATATAGALDAMRTKEALVDGSKEGTVAWIRGRTAIMLAAWDGLGTARTMAKAYVAATPDTAW